MTTGGFPACKACGGAHAAGTTCDGIPDPRLDTVLADKYRIMSVLGRGGMGSVYEARHVELGRRFAIKFLRPEFATNRAILRRFENEAKAAGSLEHPNLVAVTDIGRAPDGSPYLVMEFLPGQDCAELLARLGPLPVRRATNIVLQACLGLAVAHRAGIVHRDIKPENLYVADAGDGTDLVKVLDFGIAKLRQPDTTAATGAGVAMGTCFYMSPEQIRNAAAVDHRTDVWALGVVLYELLTGRKPFSSTSHAEIFHQILNLVPERVDKLRNDLALELVTTVERALAKDPDQRLPTVTVLAEALAPFTGRPSVAPVAGAPSAVATRPSPESVPGPARSRTSQAGVSTVSKIVLRATSRRKWAIAGLGAGVLVIALGAVRLLSGRGAWSYEPAPSASTSSVAAASPQIVPASQSLLASSEPLASAPVVSPTASDSSVGTLPAPEGARRLSEHAPPGSVAPVRPGARNPRPPISPPASVAMPATSAQHAQQAPKPPPQAVTIDPRNPY